MFNNKNVHQIFFFLLLMLNNLEIKKFILISYEFSIETCVWRVNYFKQALIRMEEVKMDPMDPDPKH